MQHKHWKSRTRMENSFLKGINHVHFIGINGSSMSGLAILLNERNIKVTGSDIEHTKSMQTLLSKGIHVYVPHDKNQVGNPDLIVFTAAISKNNEEYIYGLENNIPLMERAYLLSHLMDEHVHKVAISGAHGKTTATTLTAYLMENLGMDPTIHIGGEADFIGGSVKNSKSDYFVTEADEFKDSYLKLNPTIGVILNIDFDHVDWFGTFENMKKSFANFIEKIDKNGYLIACYDDQATKEVAQGAKCNLLFYGIGNKDLDYTAMDLEIDKTGRPSYNLYVKGKKICHVKLEAQGEHNALNSLAAIAVMDVLKADLIKTSQLLSTTHGPKRRFDLIGEVHDIKVYSDYAHHPREIEVTLETASKMAHNKIYAAFEAHTFSRVRRLFDHFVRSFKHADIAIIADIYNDRETTDTEVSGEILAKAVNEKVTKALYLPSYQAIEDYLYELAQPGDIIIVLGSKYLEGICKSLVDRLEKKFEV